MDSPPLDNRTEFAVHPQVLLDRDGERLVAIVKATFELPPGGTELELASAARMRPMWFADVPWGKKEISSVAYPSDLCVRKPGTDVIVVAEAFAPEGRAVPSFDALARVGKLEKAVKVFGPRVWVQGGAGLTAPQPIDHIEMRYDFAWGGFDDSNPKDVREEPRNPVGMGMVRDSSALTHQPAPHIEDPAYPIRDCRTRPPPAGIGPIGRHWEPRRRYVGTYDDSWKELRAPLPPKDFDDRYNLCASPGLGSATPVVGGEQVALLNLVPGGGALQFKLPRIGVELEFRVKDREPVVLYPHLDTVLVDTLAMGPDKPLAVEMVWRASVKAPRRMNDSETIVREVAWQPRTAIAGAA